MLLLMFRWLVSKLNLPVFTPSLSCCRRLSKARLRCCFVGCDSRALFAYRGVLLPAHCQDDVFHEPTPEAAATPIGAPTDMRGAVDQRHISAGPRHPSAISATTVRERDDTHPRRVARPNMPSGSEDRLTRHTLQSRLAFEGSFLRLYVDKVRSADGHVGTRANICDIRAR